MNSISVTAVKGLAIAEDSGDVTVSLVTKYAGDIAITMPAACLDQIKAAMNRAPAAAFAGDGKKPAGVQVSVPKKWSIAADMKNRGLVVIVFDHGTPAQTGFALGPKAAKELAAGLVQNADAVLAHKAGKPQ
jgi:hypothetical protein